MTTVGLSDEEWYPVLTLTAPMPDHEWHGETGDLPPELIERVRAAKNEFAAAVAAVYDHLGKKSAWNGQPYRPGWMEN